MSSVSQSPSPTEARAARQRTVAKMEKWRKVRRILLSLLAITALGILLIAISMTKPRSTECLTTEFTFCPEIIQQKTAQLATLPWWKVAPQAEIVRNQILNDSAEYVSASWKWSWTGVLQFTLEPAPMLFPVRWNETLWWVRGNQTLTPLVEEESPFPVIDLTTGHLVEKGSPNKLVGLSSVEQNSLALLFKQLQPIRPQIKRVAVHSPEFVELFPEGKGKILVHIQSEDAVRQQVATLQAFFLSSTMNQEYQELDLRFENIVIR